MPDCLKNNCSYLENNPDLPHWPHRFHLLEILLYCNCPYHIVVVWVYYVNNCTRKRSNCYSGFMFFVLTLFSMELPTGNVLCFFFIFFFYSLIRFLVSSVRSTNSKCSFVFVEGLLLFFLLNCFCLCSVGVLIWFKLVNCLNSAVYDFVYLIYCFAKSFSLSVESEGFDENCSTSIFLKYLFCSDTDSIFSDCSLIFFSRTAAVMFGILDVSCDVLILFSGFDKLSNFSIQLPYQICKTII